MPEWYGLGDKTAVNLLCLHQRFGGIIFGGAFVWNFLVQLVLGSHMYSKFTSGLKLELCHFI